MYLPCPSGTTHTRLKRGPQTSRLDCRPKICPLRHSSICCATKNKSEVASKEPGAGLKAVWYGAEQFGKLVSLIKGKETGQQIPTCQIAKLSREEIIASLREDYGKNYFVSGEGDMRAYAPDCVYADPFVSFSGTDRFKQNVGNLGGLMKDITLDIYSWEERENEVEAQWRFSCILDLPWRPKLAAAGGTTHVIDPQLGLVVRHIERWDVEPAKVVTQLLKPSARVPGNRWETLFLALSDGDAKGVWFSLTNVVIKLCGPIVGVSLLCKAITGDGLPGVALGAVEGVSYLALVAALVTEVIKFAQGMQGGETGTGGRF